MKTKTFLAIDFDGTIATKAGDQLFLIDGVKEALETLKANNCFILIDSNRANAYRKKLGTVEKSLAEMKEFLDLNKIPYDLITGLDFAAAGKPIADFYISNNNIQLTTWAEVVTKIIGDKSSGTEIKVS